MHVSWFRQNKSAPRHTSLVGALHLATSCCKTSTPALCKCKISMSAINAVCWHGTSCFDCPLPWQSPLASLPKVAAWYILLGSKLFACHCFWSRALHVSILLCGLASQRSWISCLMACLAPLHIGSPARRPSIYLDLAQASGQIALLAQIAGGLPQHSIIATFRPELPAVGHSCKGWVRSQTYPDGLCRYGPKTSASDLTPLIDKLLADEK